MKENFTDRQLSNFHKEPWHTEFSVLSCIAYKALGWNSCLLGLSTLSTPKLLRKKNQKTRAFLIAGDKTKEDAKSFRWPSPPRTPWSIMGKRCSVYPWFMQEANLSSWPNALANRDTLGFQDPRLQFDSNLNQLRLLRFSPLNLVVCL